MRRDQKRINIIHWQVVCLVLTTIFAFSCSNYAKAEEEERVAGDTPRVFIETTENINKDAYVGASIYVVDKKTGKNKVIEDTKGKIKIRGNSTSSLAKLPYNIKLSEKKNVLEMGKSKKWCLLANYLDPTLIRNKLAYDFADSIGVPYGCKNEYVNLYLNGLYQGNYLMTVPVQAGKSAVDIDVKNVDEENTEWENGDYLLEVDSQMEVGVPFVNTDLVHLIFNEPENPTENQIKEVQGYLKQVEKVLKEGTYEDICKVVDVDSFINFYLTQEFFKNMDVNTSSTRFFIKDGVLYAGPFWDADLSAGNCSTTYDGDNFKTYNNLTGYGDSSEKSYVGRWALASGSKQDPKKSWIGLLLEKEEFKNAFYQRYLDIQGEIEA